MIRGRHIGFTPSASTAAAAGIWTLRDLEFCRSQSAWPEATTSPPAWSFRPKLLLHFNGANQATTTTDSSSFNWPVTLHTNARISTSQSKFGGSSLLLGGSTNTRATVASQFNILQADFTVDCWVRLEDAYSGSSAMVCEIGDHNDDGVGMYLMPLSDGTWLPAFWFGAGTQEGFSQSNYGTLAMTAGEWTHLAWSCVASAENVYEGYSIAGQMRMFVNGLEAGYFFLNGYQSVFASNNTVTVGGSSGLAEANVFAGRIDELRIVIGSAEYSSGFSLPESAYA